MNKPIIGIVGRENLSSQEGRAIFSVDDCYRRAVIEAGGIPLSILPTQDYIYPHENLEGDRELDKNEEEDLLAVLKMCDGFIIPGGCKIFYYDKYIVNYALDNDIPVLGICLGMQIFAAVDCEGEKVIQPITNGVDHRIKELFAHKVKISKDSKLYDIVKSEEFMVNSKHRCNVIKTNKFDIVGYSEDGIIEAIERKDKKFAIGVQWHPEIICEESKEAMRIFEELIKSCEK